MVKEIIDQILSAEAEAKLIIDEAMQNAKQVNLEAEAEARNIIEKGKQDIRDERAKAISLANKDAEKNRNRILRLGQEKHDKIVNESDVSEATNRIVELFLEKYQ